MSSRPDQILARRGGSVELLRIPACLMGMLTRLRNTSYDWGLFRSHQVSVPVVSVGNLTVGGTGKTPMVAWVVKALLERGFHPGVLSRGYHADKQNVSSEETGARLNDEGRLFEQLFPGLPQVQQPDRVAGALELQKLGADVIVLDDGFQHRRLHRDIDLVLVDGTRPWGLPDVAGKPAVRALLPRGLMREGLGSLLRASALLITRSDALDGGQLEDLESVLQQEAPGCVRLLGEHCPTGLRRGSQALPLNDLNDRPVRLVSGIGNPEAFERTARSAGARIESVHAFPDHHAFTTQELESLQQGVELLVTSKDSVKLEALGVPHLVLEVEFRVTRGDKVLNALLDALPLSTRSNG